MGAVRLPDGTLAIGDAGSARVVFFDRQGRFVRAVGRLGDGPGEYRFLRWLGKCSDGTVAAYDGGHNSVTFLSAVGEMVGSMSLPVGLSFESPFWCAGPSQVMVLYNKSRDRVRPGQHLAIPTAIVRVRGPDQVDTIQAGGVQEYYVAKSVGASVELPLGAATLVAAGPSRIFSASSTGGAVEVFDTAGVRVASSFSLRFPRLRVKEPDWTRALQARIEAEPLERTQKVLEVVLKELDSPAQFPAVDQIRADAANRLWVRTYDNFATDASTWLILDANGAPVAAAVTWRALDVLEIGRDYLLGVLKDPEGVERVVQYRFQPFGS